MLVSRVTVCSTSSMKSCWKWNQVKLWTSMKWSDFCRRIRFPCPLTLHNFRSGLRLSRNFPTHLRAVKGVRKVAEEKSYLFSSIDRSTSWHANQRRAQEHPQHKALGRLAQGIPSRWTYGQHILRHRQWNRDDGEAGIGRAWADGREK